MGRYDVNSQDSLWRQRVKSRDDNTCQACGVRRSPYFLHAHHIFSYSDNPMLRTDLKNGLTLCSKCHNAFHDRYGRGGNTRFQLDAFLKTITKKPIGFKKPRLRKFKVKNGFKPSNHN